MTALGGKADLRLQGVEWLLLTQSGHSRLQASRSLGVHHSNRHSWWTSLILRPDIFFGMDRF